MAQPFFNASAWTRALAQPDWYDIIYPEFEALIKKSEHMPAAEYVELKSAVYGFLEERLATGNVVLGTTGKDFDAERKPIDTIVVHHTKCPPGITWQRLNAMHLLRLYAKSYHSPSTEKNILGKPVWSGHFRTDTVAGQLADRQVFYAYHWLVRMDGFAERLLADSETGWQAGSWEMNCRSVALCFDNDLETSTPPPAAINAMQKIVKEHYSRVLPARIIGHREVNPHTTCPGELFLHGWKQMLIMHK
ncbi:MAG: hypothetical protein A2676_01755 [Candidatus Sungbacteria bacterium RIFCSPHIGHO2_01_FULL_51_22]|nr:MAG: hypothetical protein A2676_01755 [Candidatus Sungbacteria bacterium RIFCSPHIGHO2_01_FULL_51_22]